MSKRKKCAGCGQSRLLRKFHTDNSRPDGLYTRCRACCAQYNAERRLKPEVRADQARSMRRWREGNIVHVTARRMHDAAAARARKKKIPFSLPRNFVFEKLVAGKCEITGLKLNVGVKGKRGPIPMSPTLDRRVPELGYISSNVRLACCAYNMAKGSGTDADVLLIAKALIAQERKRERRRAA